MQDEMEKAEPVEPVQPFTEAPEESPFDLSPRQESKEEMELDRPDKSDLYFKNRRCSLLRSSKFCRLMSTRDSDITIHPSLMAHLRSESTISLKSTDADYFCDWYPDLFGIDEDLIPSPEESLEGEYPELDGMITQDVDAGDELASRPLYGRRAREKPMLSTKDGKKFECICDIDMTFERHYVPHFGGGVKSEKGDWRIPHFMSFWDDYKEGKAEAEDADLFKMIEGGHGGDELKKKQMESGKTKLKPLDPLYGNKNIRDIRKKTLQKLRPMTCRELRRYRLPFSEAIILELQEDGYLETASFFRGLIMEEHVLDQTREPCATLRNSKNEILKMVELLTAVEKKGRKFQTDTQSTILLKLGRYFCDMEPTWWWIADRLFERAVEKSRGCLIDGGRCESIAQYVYGTFLLDYEGKVKEAQEHLTRARELSVGRDWNASKILNKVQEPIYKECSNYLCRALIEGSKGLRKEGKPEAALQYIHQAYKLCQESCISRNDIEMETLFELGMTYQALGELDWAITAFKKFMTKAKTEDQLRSTCDGHLELAICYRMAKEPSYCQYHLETYLKLASANNDENLKAFGNRYLGEFFLNRGYSEKATNFFEESFNSFLTQCRKAFMKPFGEWLPEDFTLPQDVELARVLTGLAKGETLTKPICRLILRSQKRNQNDTLKLIKWKDEQEISLDFDEQDDNLYVPSEELDLKQSTHEFFTNPSEDSFLMRNMAQDSDAYSF